MPAAIVDERERRSKCFGRTGFSLSSFDFFQSKRDQNQTSRSLSNRRAQKIEPKTL